MLNSSYLASVADELVLYYSNLEHDIAMILAKKIEKVQKITDSVEYSLKITEEVGVLRQDVLKLISKYNSQAEPILKKSFDDALTKSKTNDLKYFQYAKRELSDNQRQLIETSVKRFLNADKINKTFSTQQRIRNSFDNTYKNIQRMTMTVADSTQKRFIEECNRAYMKVSTGMTTYQSAYKTAIKNLAEDGIKTVSYSSSGKPLTYSIESAMRMNVLTGINETASTQTLENCEVLDTDLVEVSAHIGARDTDGKNEWSNHAQWQGKVYCLNGEREYIDAEGKTQIAKDFYSSCGLGEADGICGINCRHSYYPYFEGTPQLYSDKQLDEMKEQSVYYDDHEMSRCEAEQKQRYIERNIRNYKRQVDSIEAIGGDSTNERVKLGEWQALQRDFTKQTGLRRDYTREMIGTNKEKTIRKAIKENKTNSNFEKIKPKKLTEDDKLKINKIEKLLEDINFISKKGYINLQGADVESSIMIKHTLINCFNNFPEMKGFLNGISLKYLNNNEYAIFDTNKKIIIFNQKIFSNFEELNKFYYRDNLKIANWHIKNTNSSKIVEHEFGHAYNNFLAWKKGLTEKNIAEKIFFNMKKKYKLFNPSQMAKQDIYEFFAECFSCLSNIEKSKEIIYFEKLLKEF